MNISIHPYTTLHQTIWDTFIEQAPNSSFILKRKYMEYHQDRFDDHSVMLWSKEKLLAVFPANKEGKKWYSHQGLSYGGLLFAYSLSLRETTQCWIALLHYAVEQGFEEIIYKPMPLYYYPYPINTDDQILFWLDAQLLYTESGAVIYDSSPQGWQSRRRRGFKKALHQNLSTAIDRGWDTFWDILSQNLSDRHGIQPVHSLEEIRYLKQSFPQNIQLFTCHKNGKTLGGAVIFKTPQVAHAQYIAGSPEGKSLYALDLLFPQIFDHYKNLPCISLGVSSLRKTQQVNKGLQEWKESWGAVPIPHKAWVINPNNWKLLQNRFLSQ